MSILSLIVALVLIGVLLWVINMYVPMDIKIKNILNIVVVLIVVIWLLNVFGVIGGLQGARVPRLK